MNWAGESAALDAQVANQEIQRLRELVKELRRQVTELNEQLHAVRQENAEIKAARQDELSLRG